MISSLAIAAIVFACILAGTLIGMFIARVLPEDHLNGESKESVKQGLALIATLTALVLGLLVATTKGTYDNQSSAVREIAANVTVLDRLLARYGSAETKEIREAIPAGVQSLIDVMWPNSNSVNPAEMRVAWETMFDKISALEPKTDAQRMLKPRAGDHAFTGADATKVVGAEREFDSSAVSGGPDLLVNHSVWLLWLAGSPKSDGHRHPGRVHDIGIRCALFGP